MNYRTSEVDLAGPEVDVWEIQRNLIQNKGKIKFLNWQSHVPARDLIGINPKLRSLSFSYL
jgi:hypothetical protein